MFTKRSLRSEKLIKKKRRKLFIKVVFYVLVFIILIISFSFISKIDSLEIKEVSITGNENIRSEVLADIFTETTEGNYVFLFSKKNIFIFPKSKFKNRILNEFLDIKDLSIKRIWLEGVLIEIEERKEHSLFCLTEKHEENIIFSNECFFLDEEGFIFSKAPQFLEKKYFRYFKQKDSLFLGEVFMDYKKFSNINNFIEKLSSTGLKPNMFFADELGDFEIYFTGGEKIIFKGDDNYNNVFENLFTLLSENDFDLIKDNGSLNFEYIDLRFGNRIFYSLK